MAILKRGSGVWRVSRESNSCSDEDNRPYDEAADSSDSCKGSDVGEIGSELCRVGEHRCNIPYEIFDLPDLRPILSLDTWNYWLTDEERFSLSAYLPDMDQQTFIHTLKQLLAGENFHFGSPLFDLFDMLKGGLCQPEVSRYREGLEYLQKKEHYHFLRKYQNSMVKNLLEMRETWEHCRNLGVEERLHMRSSWKNLKGLAQAEPRSLSQRHSEQMLETLQKGRPEKPSARSSRKQNLAKDVNKLEMDPSLLKGKGQLHNHLLGLEGIEKLGKRTTKGILKMAPKCGLRKNGQTEMHLESDQETPFAEMQNLKTKYKSSSALPHTSEWEVDDLVEETPFTMRKTRSRTRINGLEMTFNNMKEHRSWNYLNKNSGLVKSTLERCRKLGRVKEQEISERVGVQEAPKFGENIGRYKEGSNLAGGNKTLENSKKSRERAKILTEYWWAQPQEMPRERASMISSKDLRKYPQERGMFDVSLYADGQGQKTDKKKRNPIDYHKKPTKQYRETFDQDIGASEQPVLSFGHKMILDDKELANKEQKIYENKKGDKECNKILEQLRKENMEINQSSKGFLRFTVKQKMPADEHKLECQSECLGSQSELVENRKYALGFNFPLDNSKRSHEGKKKKRKKRQINEVMTFDLEKTQGESSSLDSPKEGMKPPQGFEWAMKGTEKTETEETFPPQTEESEDMATSGDIDGKPVSNVDITSFCHQWDEGTILQKKTEKNTEEDINVLNVGASNKSHGDAQSTLGKQAEEEKHLMNMVKRTSKEDADILTGVRESNGLQNSQLSQLEQVGGLKPWKKVGKKKLEDSKILDVMAEANHIQVSPGSTMYVDSDEFKATIRKAKKVKVDSETLDGKAESNVLHCDDYPSLCQQSDEGKPGKKRSRKKVDDTAGSLMSFPLKQASIADKVTLDAKALKKSSTLVVPPVVSSFAFSVIHFLSAVRTAMLSPSAEDISEVVNHSEKSDGERESSNQEGQFTISCDGKVEEQNFVIPNYPFDGRPDKCMGGSIASHLERERQTIPYSIPFQEIVKRVQMNPGDPCVLKIQEPLQDLVRGALKIFASKTAPQGVKGWKPLAVYDKSTRSWSWIGPVYSISPRHESLEVQTCSEAWGISQKMLLKLVEAFANWLKNGQETLQQIVLLPSPPPPSMLTCLNEKERFRDLRAQKSSITITPSSSVMRTYFRREEVLRYSVPDRAFAYTAADGRKAVVAPLRRCGGKPTSKARDHFMLKPDRPPHVTILCLVRDAAARLPGSIGTRADVCTLIRDSQYIVEDVSDAQVNQVVSGALDRLHYERDPCVQFDGERKLWVYLHTERDEEDFEDDGTSSTKRWKRQKKEHFDNSDLGPCNDSPYHCRDDQDACGSGLGFDFCSPDYNGDSSSIYSGGKAELVYNRNGSLTSPRVLRSFNGSNIEDGMVPFIELPPSIHSIPGSMRENHLMGWEVLGLNPSGHGSNLQSQEHVSNGDFDNNTFSKERPTELLSSRLL